MANQITFLNHSSVILITPNIKILCDPWFNGTAFGEGWSLLHDASHDINSIEFDYIWLSHEHPDHFSIPTLNQLNSSKTFLYQETKDKKIKSYLEKKGHKVIEIPNKKTFTLKDLELTVITCDGYDSSLIAKFPNNKVVVNINDARVDLDDHLGKEIIPFLNGFEVDLLMFQFGYANWAGNMGDSEIPVHQQNLVDKKNDYIINMISPKVIMPFASFIYFSHEENFYWNDTCWLNHIFSKYSNMDCNLMFPIPNQTFNLGEFDQNDFSVKNRNAKIFWEEKIKDIKPKTISQVRTIKELNVKYDEFLNNLHKRNSIFKLIDKENNYCLTIKITDLDKIVCIGLVDNKFAIDSQSEKNISIEVSSEVLLFLLSQSFGRGTVTINSRINFNYDFAHNFFLFFFIFYANNLGIYFHELNRITKDKVQSISRTSVMESILLFNKNSPSNMSKDIEYFMSIFDTKENLDSNFDIFNQEPPNSDM